MLLYLLICCFALFCSWVAQKQESKFWLFLCIIAIACFSALRGEYVGVDTNSYYHQSWELYKGSTLFLHEPVHGLSVKCIMSYFKHPAAVIFIYSTITQVLIISRLWTFRKSCCLPVMLLVYFCDFYFASMNIMRQFLAIAIIFWGSMFLENSKYVRFIVCLAIATLFHTSAILGLNILFLSIYFKSKESVAIRKIVRYSLIPFILTMYFVYMRYFIKIILMYRLYFKNTEYKFGLMGIYRILCIMFILYMAQKNILKNKFCMSYDGKPLKLDGFVTSNFLIGVIISFLGMFFPYMGRIGLYSFVFEMPFWGQAIRIEKGRSFVHVLFFVFVLYVYIGSLTGNGYGIWPYYTIFAGVGNIG